MSPSWERKRIAELAHHSLGKMLDKAKNQGEPRPYLRNLNVRWFEFDLSDVLEMRFLPSETERYTVRKGDVVVCEGGYPGRAAIWDDDEPIYFQKALHRVRFHEPTLARWFLYYLHARDLDGTLKAHFNGSGIQHFTGEALARFELPVPPLDEQQRILAVLDEAFAGIAAARANAERNLRNARALFESRLAKLFSERDQSWVEAQLGEVCTFRNGLWKGESPPLVRVGVVRNTNFTKRGTLDLTDVAYLDVEAKQFATRRLQSGDIILEKSGGGPKQPVGRVVLFENAEGEFSFSNFTSALRVTDTSALDPRFLHQYLHWLYMSGVTEGMQSNSTSIRNLNGHAYKAIVIAYPPVCDQRTLLARIEALTSATQELERIYQRKLAGFDELKRSLLHHAFTGQLTARTAAALAG